MDPGLLVGGTEPPAPVAPGGGIVPLLMGLLLCCSNRAFFDSCLGGFVNLGSTFCAFECEVVSQYVCPPL